MNTVDVYIWHPPRRNLDLDKVERYCGSFELVGDAESFSDGLQLLFDGHRLKFVSGHYSITRKGVTPSAIT